jgi:hypothetical protein
LLLFSCVTCPARTLGERRSLTGTEQRRCQLRFEPAFHRPYTVWIAQQDKVLLELESDGGVETLSASLDGRSADQLSRACLAALTTAVSWCENRGYDGVWYHAAQGQFTAKFWSPRNGTLAAAYVELGSALRDYVAIHDSLRYGQWLRLQGAKNDLLALLR